VKVWLIAGEPSGDRLGGALMAGLRALHSDVTFTGIGGPVMAAQGLDSRIPLARLSVMGIAEILPRFFEFKRLIRETAAAILADPPDVIVTIDFPDFTLRVLHLVRAARPDLRTVHYVAPSVWAWRPGRAARMAPLVDHVLALLPFEPPLMQAAGMGCTFVGHPVVSEPLASPDEIAAFRARYGRVLLVLPGSRGSEVTRLAPRFGAALREVLARHDLRVVVPTVAAQEARVRALVADWPGNPVVLDPGDAAAKRAAFGAAEFALAASGTVSLELAANTVPMLIAYDFAPITRWLMRRMALIDTVTLVNLVSDTRAVPECILSDCTPPRIARALETLITDRAAQDAQRAAMALTLQRLGRGGEAPGLRAARAVLQVAGGQGGCLPPSLAAPNSPPEDI
jgi:lipid-A-disaccharide synthase